MSSKPDAPQFDAVPRLALFDTVLTDARRKLMIAEQLGLFRVPVKFAKKGPPPPNVDRSSV